MELESPYKGIPFMAYLHLSAVNPERAVGQHVTKGDLIGWVGGGTSEVDYEGTNNPTGINFLNTTSRSSQIKESVQNAKAIPIVM